LPIIKPRKSTLGQEEKKGKLFFPRKRKKKKGVIRAPSHLKGRKRRGRGMSRQCHFLSLEGEKKKEEPGHSTAGEEKGPTRRSPLLGKKKKKSFGGKRNSREIALYARRRKEKGGGTGL